MAGEPGGIRSYRDPNKKYIVLDVYEFDEDLGIWVSDCKVPNGTVRYIDGALRYSVRENFILEHGMYDISRCAEITEVTSTVWYPCDSAE